MRLINHVSIMFSFTEKCERKMYDIAIGSRTVSVIESLEIAKRKKKHV